MNVSRTLPGIFALRLIGERWFVVQLGDPPFRIRSIGAGDPMRHHARAHANALRRSV